MISTERISDQPLLINSCGVDYTQEKSRGSLRPNGRVDYHLLYVHEGSCHVRFSEEDNFLEVGEGSVNSAAVPIRRIVEMALASNASSVVLAHNHPSGFAVPSEEDVHTTYRLAMALSAVEIQLVDHIVVADGDYVSMAQSHCFDPRDSRLLI